MNIAKIIKSIKSEIFKERNDLILKDYLTIILNKLCKNDFTSDDIVIDPYGNDYIYDVQNVWTDNNIPYKQRILAQKQAIKQLNTDCKKLTKFGFNCKVKTHKNIKQDNYFIIYAPFIIIKL